jgi:hypothetical protein
VLDCDWRSENRCGAEAITQAIGRAARACRLEGLIVPSAARACGTNLIVFPYRLMAGDSLKVTKEVEWPAPRIMQICMIDFAPPTGMHRVRV